MKERKAVLQIRYENFEIKRPLRLNKNKNLKGAQEINVIYVREEQKNNSVEPVEWFLMTNEKVECVEDAYEKAV